MRKLYSRVVRVTVLWTVLLAGMAVVAGTSAVVLASNGPIQLDVCNTPCGDFNGYSCPSFCNCPAPFMGSAECKWPTF